jgi:uncharacterized protein YlzI (FlbEa/FlbD family)
MNNWRALMFIILAFHLVQFTGVDGQEIDINPQEIVSVREVRPSETQHFDKKIKCIIHTSDGKFIAVTEDCGTVRNRLEENDG